MSTALSAFLIFIGVGIAVWLISFIVESLRPVQQAPRKLRWAPDIPIDYVELGGNKLRYIKTGTGPTLVLLHTLRTQLDLFEKVVPELSKHFTVTPWTIRAMAIRRFQARHTTPPFLPRRSKASSISLIFAM
jgi:hypothetical protein